MCSVRKEAGRNVTRNAALVGALTGVSRVLGLVREMLTARLFGTSPAQSAFVVAFTIPNLFRRLFGEGALSAAFVPAFSKSLTQESKTEALVLSRRVVTLLASLLTAVVALGLATAWVGGHWAEPGGRLALTLPLLRIMLPYAIFICLAAISMGMLNVLGDFRSPALAPALLNIVWIAMLVGVCPWLRDDVWVRVVAVSWGIVFAGVAQFGYLWYTLRRRGWTLRWQGGGLADARVRRVWQQALPAALGAGVVQINVCLDFLLAFWASSWAPSALTYADRILYLPMGVVATAFGTVLLPTFSRQFAENDTDGMRRTLRSALSDLTLVMMPAAVGLAALAPQIVGVLYERGQFDAQATLRTARALACYAPGLVVFSVHKVLNPLFYGLHDTRTPMRVAALGVLLNLVLNVTFVLTWPTEWKHAGIAVATVISSAVASVILARLAAARIGALGWGPVLATMAKALAASAVMALAARGLHRWVLAALQDSALQSSATLVRVLALALAIVGGGAVYAACMAALCPKESQRVARELLHRVMRRARPGGR